jgi:hypothetical protein
MGDSFKDPTPPAVVPYVPGAGEVESLIARAREHPLGLPFLLDGHLGSVATTFRTHAFTVDAARERLKREER